MNTVTGSPGSAVASSSAKNGQRSPLSACTSTIFASAAIEAPMSAMPGRSAASTPAANARRICEFGEKPSRSFVSATGNPWSLMFLGSSAASSCTRRPVAVAASATVITSDGHGYTHCPRPAGSPSGLHPRSRSARPTTSQALPMHASSSAHGPQPATVSSLSPVVGVPGPLLSPPLLLPSPLPLDASSPASPPPLGDRQPGTRASSARARTRVVVGITPPTTPFRAPARGRRHPASFADHALRIESSGMR